MRELDETPAGGPIGARLAAWRRRRGLTRDDLSSSTGLGFGYLAGLETGGEWMDRRGRLTALATALRLDVADLTGQPYPPRGRSMRRFGRLPSTCDAAWSADKLIRRTACCWKTWRNGPGPRHGPMSQVMSTISRSRCRS